ncbi:MAG: glycosyltransferase family 39 protein [Hyphomicrobiales bacterium]|nr:glycosyltransferase family 39 protein [Hyphomicrobiales bacterium]
MDERAGSDGCGAALADLQTGQPAAMTFAWLRVVRFGGVGLVVVVTMALPWLSGGTPWIRETVPWLGRINFGGPRAVWLAAMTLAAFIVVCAGWRNLPDLSELGNRLRRPFLRLRLWHWMLIVAVCSWFVGGIWLRGFPISDDVYAVMLQADTYASGQWVAAAPPLPPAFDHPRLRIVGDAWISQYLPGWAMILAPLAWIGAPLWLAPGAFAAGSLVFFWMLARRRLDAGLATVATLILCSSAFFVLNASTLYSHAPATFFGLAAVESTLRRRAGGHWRWAIFAGASIGAMGLIRPYNAAIFTAVLGLALLFDWGRRRDRQSVVTLVAFGLGGLPFALALLGYQAMMTGSPFKTIPAWFGGGGEPLGMISALSLENAIHRFARLGIITSPVLVVAAFVAPVVLGWARKLTVVDWVFPATVFAFLFYEGRGGIPQSYGPRYLFEAFPFLVLSSMAAASLLSSRWPVVRAWVVMLLVTQTFGLLSWLAYERDAIQSLSEPFRLAARANLKHAVVILETPPGVYRRGNQFDYARNGLDVTKPSVVYARDLGDRDKLRALFPDRAFYVYRDGKLMKIKKANRQQEKREVEEL